MIRRLVASSVVCLIANSASAAGPLPPLTPAQTKKLEGIRAAFVPGSKEPNHEYEFMKEQCGFQLPIEIEPNTVVFDHYQEPDRTQVESTCAGLVDAVTYTCREGATGSDGVPLSDRPKEFVKAGVKRLLCRATGPGADFTVNEGDVRYTLTDGTLTLTYGPNPGNINEKGTRFLNDVLRLKPGGISLKGYLLKEQWQIVMRAKPGDGSSDYSTLRASIRDECGIDLSLELDDELAEKFSQQTRNSGLSGCDSALQTVYNFCGRSDTMKPAVKAAMQKKLKGVSCVYGEKAGAELKNGILIVRSNLVAAEGGAGISSAELEASIGQAFGVAPKPSHHRR